MQRVMWILICYLEHTSDIYQNQSIEIACKCTASIQVFLIPFTLTRYDVFMTEENWKTPPGLSFSGITMVVWVEPTFNLWVSEGETEVKVIVISSSNSGVSSGIMVMISRDSELPEKNIR